MTTDKIITWGEGYSTKIVHESALEANPWNPNKQADDVYLKVKRSLQQHGFVELPQVRQLEDGRYQIINGEHRVRAARELGIAEIPVIDLGQVTDQVAKKLTIITNELRGAPEPILLSKLVRELSVEESMGELALELPFQENELESLSKLTEAFDWNSLEASLPEAPAGEKPKPPPNTGGERKFQIGTTKGNIPTALATELITELNTTMKALNCGIEVALKDWVARLGLVPPGQGAS